MAKKYSNTEAAQQVDAIMQQVLERPATPEDYVHWGARLARGEQSVRSIVSTLAKGQEHMDGFLRKNNLEECVHTCYRHFLGRDADAGGLETWVDVFQFKGIDDVIDGIVNSQEYVDKFGEDIVPHA